MKKLTRSVTLLIALFVLGGCASGYKMINPPKINYTSNGNSNNVVFEYKYDLLNPRYGNKEKKFGIKLVAVKITNNTPRDLVFDKDIKITYVNGNELALMDNAEVFSTLKQQPLYHLGYLSFGLLGFDLLSTRAPYNANPLFDGALIAAGNITYASIANGRFNNELTKYNLTGTTIQKGSTVYGLVGIKEDSFELLKIKVL